jgi:predicted Rossmann fold flavoprotein
VEFDVIVIGGGAAGLMCAATAVQRGRRVLVLEGSNKPGKKILMSGGGRCNFTNLYCGPEHFTSQNPHFCKSALKRYSPYEFLGLVDKHGIPHVEKAAGQLFCERSSKDILAMLLQECEDATLVTEAGIERVERGERWQVNTAKGRFFAESLVVATGGLSIPKMGASGFGYELARQFDLDVVPTRAGLVPFTFTGVLKDVTGRLSGVSVPAAVSAGEATFSDHLLFTHRGMSGPAALQASSFWEPGHSIAISLLPQTDIEAVISNAKLATPRARLRTALGALLPRALVSELETLFFEDVADTPLDQLGNSRLNTIAQQLKEWILKPAATEGYRTAEVTLGGVDTDAMSSRTFECIAVPGLYFIGEVLDVTGQLGGFNFQWAWASGRAAGEVV